MALSWLIFREDTISSVQINILLDCPTWTTSCDTLINTNDFMWLSLRRKIFAVHFLCLHFSWSSFEMFLCIMCTRKSHRRCTAENGILKSFTNFTGKHLFWSIFLIKSQAFQSATLLKKKLQQSCFAVKFAKFLKAHSQVWDNFLASENPLKVMENAFFTSKVFFVLNIFRFLLWPFGHVAKRLHEKDKSVTVSLTNN